MRTGSNPSDINQFQSNIGNSYPCHDVVCILLNLCIFRNYAQVLKCVQILQTFDVSTGRKGEDTMFE